MRAVLIDSLSREVRDVEYDGDYRSIYKLIRCQLFTVIRGLPGNDDLFVDDEGLLTSNRESQCFRVSWYPAPLIGSGLILSCDDDGNAAPSTHDANYYREHVKFSSLEAELLREHLMPSGWLGTRKEVTDG